jgi:murein L,D-transpeptidase YcbB/YkuD
MMKSRNLAVMAAAAFAIGAAWSAISVGQDIAADLNVDVGELDVRIDDKIMEVGREREITMRKAKEAQKAAQKVIQKAHEDMKRVQHFHIENRNFNWTGQPSQLEELREAAEKYRDADGEAQKAEQLRRLHDIAAESFEKGMKAREKELADVEARVQKLRTQLERRRAKKEEIIDLQVKVAINEAEGLGFTSQAPPHMWLDFTAPKPVIFKAPPSADAAPPQPPIAPRVDPFEPTPAVPPTLRRGAKGDAVRLLQLALNERMEPSPNINVDGDFGPETEKAVKEFQEEHDLKETGVVDPETLERLIAQPNRPPSGESFGTGF